MWAKKDRQRREGGEREGRGRGEGGEREGRTLDTSCLEANIIGSCKANLFSLFTK